MDTTTLVILALLIAVAFLILFIKILSIEKGLSAKEKNIEIINQLEKLEKDLDSGMADSRKETISYIQASFKSLADILSGSQKQSTDIQDKRLSELNNMLSQNSESLQKTVNERLKKIEEIMENRLTAMQKDNERKLEQMRETVDEKLQKTLEIRISQSFKLVSERLEQVYKGLGEMQNLASGVGDLKKVLSNVKTRGILGEIQLGAILEEILNPDQYEENIATKKGSSERVEYAIKLPGDDDGFVYLPIDAKFPAETYSRLVNAYEAGDPTEIDAAKKQLERTIKSFAKSIRDKYISPPHTTDFGIMFLPFEGLYSEVVRIGLVEPLQREYKINIAGPTTMAALLNSLQMGFKTLAIQKHSSEVWEVLAAVKTEFNKFGDVLEATQRRINQANAELDKLVGTRTRQIQSKLRNVTELPEDKSRSILGLPEGEDNEE